MTALSSVLILCILLASLPLVAQAAPEQARLAQLVGYSAGGRQILAFPLGDGPQTLALVGGMHGGSEWNTVALVELEFRARRKLLGVDCQIHARPPDLAIRRERTLNSSTSFSPRSTSSNVGRGFCHSQSTLIQKPGSA